MAWKPFRNFGLKIAALALGTLLWFTVSGHQIERRLAVPLSYSNVPASLEMTGDQFDDVTVHVRGGADHVRGLERSELSVVVDLADAQPGTNVVPLRTDEVSAPTDIEVMQIDPGTITVTLERSGQAEVPIHPIVEGTPAPGHEVGAVTVDPSTVIVVGPESLLRNPIAVITERVLVDGRASAFSQDVSVGVADAQLRLRDPRTVRVTVHIDPVAPSAPPATNRDRSR